MTANPVGDAQTPLVYLIAGEPSGDLLGARLMSALRAQTGGRVRFSGLGGELMAAQGLKSLFPIHELAVMGIVEIVPHALRIYRRIKQTVAAVRLDRPDVLVTIDSPSFSLEVSQRLKGQGFPLIHYVAPSVWAWKPWRARHVARYLDHLLALLPFEPPYFEKHGLATTFVGHPAIEAERPTGDAQAFRRTWNIPSDVPLLCVLPGSRRAEVRRLAPVLGDALELLAARRPGLHALIPTVAGVATMVREAVGSWPVPALVLNGLEAKYQAFAAADAALAASGTVAVELAVAGLPTVIAYRVHPLTAFLAARLVKVEHVSIPNLVLGREVQPELIQSGCTPIRLATELDRLLTDPDARAAQLADCALAARRLGLGGRSPSQRAAECILSAIGRSGGPPEACNEAKREEKT